MSFDDAALATIQIEATGTFAEPGQAISEETGRGSGFIIDPSGLAVTNNHVVVGAATLTVWVDGEEYAAEILGTSECLDLAVIDIEGDGFDYFDWYEGDIKPAQEVWAVGYPLGDPEFTITRGIVSKADSATDSAWASIDHTIEHDARIRPGNSGGPLIEGSGQVVGVNYAGDDQYDINLAISRDEVLKVLDKLTADEDVFSLGVNGTAVAFDDGSSGVFVSSVASGSPAEKIGLLPGDTITSMESTQLGEDGTVATYCSVMRTQGVNATMSVRVYRGSEDAYYEGQFNGQPLAPVSVPVAEGGGDGSGGGTTVLHDDSGTVTVEVPSSWNDVDGRPLTNDDGSEVNDLIAAPSVDAFLNNWDSSGVEISASQDWLTSRSVDDLLAESAAGLEGVCTLEADHSDYSDGYYTGSYDYWTGCGGTSTEFYAIGAKADDGSHMVRVYIQVTPDDLSAVETIVNSFYAEF